MIDPSWRTEWLLEVDARSLKEGVFNDLEFNLEGGVWDPVCHAPWVLKIWGKSGQKCQFWDPINMDPRATGLAG